MSSNARAGLALENAKQERTNHINDLSGKEWIRFTRTWFTHNPPPRRSKLLHPACFPESLVADFIQFFTKRGQWVLDPFLGTGSSLVAARLTNRNAVGVELYPIYASFAKQWLGSIESHADTRQVVCVGDSKNIAGIFARLRLPRMDFCVTSPPYWNQLSHNHRRQRIRSDRGLPTKYGESSSDIGNTENYYEFLEEQNRIFDSVFGIMKRNAYLVVITNNVFRNGRLYPLAFDTLRGLSSKWVPKDERVWCQSNKRLFPFGIFDKWVGNRAHHYCLILRKETD